MNSTCIMQCAAMLLVFSLLQTSFEHKLDSTPSPSSPKKFSPNTKHFPSKHATHKPVYQAQPIPSRPHDTPSVAHRDPPSGFVRAISRMWFQNMQVPHASVRSDAQPFELLHLLHVPGLSVWRGSPHDNCAVL
ncbi:hypothetical protein BKA63DRAFT_173315 [Paraphoma chrysanthemicola]|nr:hypothetical protein BKA63DRAFT_173315 [Paraphoma chrysanthemicola]